MTWTAESLLLVSGSAWRTWAISETTFDDTRIANAIALAQAGDRSAAEEAIVACNDLVVRVVRAHRIHSISDEDLVQEVFLRMLERLDSYRAQSGIPFRHWLSRLAVNVCIDRARGEQRRTRSLVSADSAGIVDWLCDGRTQPPDDALAANDLVETLLADLAVHDRLVLTLIDIERHTAHEVAMITGWSVSLVRVRAFRARRRLRSRAQHLQQNILPRTNTAGGPS